MTSTPRRIALALTLIAFARALDGVIGYHADIVSGQFISRVEMAAIGFEVLLGTVTVAATLIAMGKLRARATSGPAAYRPREFITGSLGAFILGMLVYLIVYPPTAWVFYTTIALAFVFGIVLLMPIDRADAPGAVALLNAWSGLAACAAGFATTNGILILVGLLTGLSGFIVWLLVRRP